MQLVIIAGGFGKRLRPLTLTRPKALIPLVDRPLVLHILDSLPPSCDEAIIAVNYLFEQVRDFFRGHESRIAVRVVEEPTPLDTGGALKNVERYLRGPFAVYNGDIVDTIDFDGLVETHRKAGGIGTIAVGPVDDPSDFGAVEIARGRITRFVEKPARGETASHLVNATLLEGVSVDDKVEIASSIVGAGAAIGEGAHVRDSILEDGVQVPPHAEVLDDRVAA